MLQRLLVDDKKPLWVRALLISQIALAKRGGETNCILLDNVHMNDLYLYVAYR